MWESTRIPVMNPICEIRLRCLEAAVQATSGKGGDVLKIAREYEDYVMRPERTPEGAK